MIESHHINAVFTDDESELVTIINGLEKQADQLEDRLEKLKNSARLMSLGSASFFGLYFLENRASGKMEYLTFSAGLAIGGIERWVKQRKMINSIWTKNILASQLKQELEPTDLERYEDKDELFFGEDDDDYGTDGYLFT